MDATTNFFVSYFLPFISFLGLLNLLYTLYSRSRMDRLRFISSSVVSTFTILFGTMPYARYNRLLGESFCNLMVFVLPVSFFLVSLLLWLLRNKYVSELK